MPWTYEDAVKHSKEANTEKKQKQWAAVANSVLERCVSNGGDQKTCEGKAISQASGVIKKLSDVSTNFYYLTDISDIKFLEEGDKKSAWIEIFREGVWTHPKHGVIEGTQKLFGDFINNWEQNVLGRQVAIDKNHNPDEGATGWIKDLKVFGDRLKAFVEFTPWGLDLIQNKGFRYFSPEYTSKYTSKDTNKEIKNVLIGGALTLRPFLTNLNPIVLSEDIKLDSYPADVQNMQTVQPIDNYDLICNFVDIIKELAISKYISIEDLKNFMLENMNKVDFTSLSDDFKTELLTVLEEYTEGD